MDDPQRPGCPDLARLAEYVDGVLDEGERVAVQQHLVMCADCREVVAETARLAAVASARRRRRGVALAWAAALAATVALSVSFFKSERWRETRSGTADFAALVAAIAAEPTRSAEGLLAGMPYAPAPPVMRGAAQREPPASVLATATRVLQQETHSPESRAAAGV